MNVAAYELRQRTRCPRAAGTPYPTRPDRDDQLWDSGEIVESSCPSSRAENKAHRTSTPRSRFGQTCRRRRRCSSRCANRSFLFEPDLVRAHRFVAARSRSPRQPDPRASVRTHLLTRRRALRDQTPCINPWQRLRRTCDAESCETFGHEQRLHQHHVPDEALAGEHGASTFSAIAAFIRARLRSR